MKKAKMVRIKQKILIINMLFGNKNEGDKMIAQSGEVLPEENSPGL